MSEWIGSTQLIWLGIAVCVVQAGMFSGLNLSLFSIGRLRLEAEAAAGDAGARSLLDLRQDSNLLLTTVLWGNVANNVALTLLSDSVMAGATAFLFSTVIITMFGEILPQAYFSRHATAMAVRLMPWLNFYRVLLFPVAKPVALGIDWWLGPEGLRYFPEHHLRQLIWKHVESGDAEIDRVEGLGALNFLAIDDVPVSQEGEPLDPRSVIRLATTDGSPAFPDFSRSTDDPFLNDIQRSGKRWVVLTDASGTPTHVLDASSFLRDALFGREGFDPLRHCHRPIIVTDPSTPLGEILPLLTVVPDYPGDNVIDRDLVLLWANHNRVITGADILGRLLSGLTMVERSGGAPLPRHDVGNRD